MFAASFAKPYPHRVAMASDQTGMDEIDLDEMVQFCLVVPMAAPPLDWNSRELAALTAYSGSLQEVYRRSVGAAANPWAARNPCAASNPCAAR